MTASLKDALLIAKTGLDKRLVSSEAISQISQVADLLPTFPTTSQAGLECHLDSSEPKADFFAAFSTSNGGREALARGYPPLADLNDSSVWNRVYDFCEHWTQTNSPLYQEVDRVWLEFDLVKPQSSKTPEPNFFFGPTKGIKNKTNNSDSPNQAAKNYSWITDEALGLLLNKSLPNLVKQNLLTCFNCLPPEASVFQIGIMLPRKAESQTVRVCINNIALSEIPQYLNAIGWQGSSAKLKSILTDLSHFTNYVCLNFAVGDTVHSKVGFECYIDKKPRINPKWRSFFDYLVEQQLCTLEKADALLNYPGLSTEKSHQNLWPSNLSDAAKLVRPDLVSTFVRILHHIKIVYQPGKPLQAKAYLWLGHLWLSGQGVFES